MPVAGMVAVPAVQAKMLHSLAGVFKVSLTKNVAAEFFGCLGTGMLIRYGMAFLGREIVKLIPAYGVIVGSAIAAATSFATTYALGYAAVLYLKSSQAGKVIDPAAIAREFNRALKEAAGLADASRMFQSDKGDKP